MKYRNVDLHNVDEVFEQPDGSVMLQRVPEPVRAHLNDMAKSRMRSAAGAEVRFVCDGPAEVTLSLHPECEADTINVVTFWGAYQDTTVRRITKQRTVFTVEPPERLMGVDPSFLDERAFSRRVRRLWFGGGVVCLHGVDGSGVRPPEPGEVPGKRLLAYGTSITQGIAATGPHLAYAALAARELGMDLVNLGSSGSCQCEPEMADYIAGRTDWDLAVLALSVNMRNFPPDEYYGRVSYMVNTVAATGRPVVCVTLWPFFGDMAGTDGRPLEPGAVPAAVLRQKLRDAVAACPHPGVHLLEGPELLTAGSGLTTDLIHPGDLGMMDMGRNLAAAIRGVLAI